MKNLENKELDIIIKKADRTFDSLDEAPVDNYRTYHAICEAITHRRNDVVYDKDIIDDRCIELNKKELDRIM